jgi:hypothetical protein
MDRRHFTFGALLGLIGVKVAGQEPSKDRIGFGQITTESQVQGSTHAPLGRTLGELGEGEEFCPLEHAQTPGTITITGDLKINMPVRLGDNPPWPTPPRVCSICGMVYVHFRK